MNLFRRKKLTFNDSGVYKVVPFTMLDELRVTLPTSFGEIFESHPAVQSVVSSIAKSLAQTSLQVFMRTIDGPRELEPNNRMGQLLRQPNLKYELGRDLLVWGETFWAMLGDKSVQELVRFSPDDVEVQGKGSLVTGFKLGDDVYQPEDVLFIRTPSVTDGLRGVSPLKSLRGVLAEDLAANAHKLLTWQGSNPGSYILRPGTAPEWSDEARARFAESLKQKGASEVAVLEEDMKPAEAHPASSSDLQFLEGRRFCLELVASVYGFPASILAGTSSDRNADAGRRALVQDCVAPLASLLEDGLNAQLVPRVFGPVQSGGGRIYVEHLIEAKLRGSFREQSQVFALASGGLPWLLPDEIREMLNLPPLAEAGPQPPIKLR